ncbi:YihY/virulence factor BrkB family protein [Bacillus sp. CGMCC 1.16541]|uniref:YihY/virulence factor BrkB family protein n=1 Tax=Bacillus sp. CGMCC 1.16541 TaxID=2185143 RepID=UPI000D72794E|nr:YihY/virulence factor BrkB family protein [Bacillus sp. CGMCC 1.16541]
MGDVKKRSVLSFGKELVARIQRDEIPSLSAELAYYFLLSMFPFLIFLITLIGFLPLQVPDILQMIDEFAPEQTMSMIESNLTTVIGQQNGELLSIGLIATIWSASNGINAIVRAFNRAYQVEENRPFIVARGMSILLTFAMIFIIVVALLLPVFGQMIGLYLFSTLGLSETFLAIWSASRWIISSAILFIVFMALYYFAPNKHLLARNVAKGAAFATIGWMAVSLAFSYYVNNFSNYTATYGSLGGIIVLLIWLYLSGMIIVIGGEINAMFYERRKREA